MDDDVTVQALDAEAARLLGLSPADRLLIEVPPPRPAGANDIIVPDVPMPLVGASLPDGRTLWFSNRKEPVGLGRGTVNFIVQHGGRLWRVEEEVIYLRLSPYDEAEAAPSINRETSRPPAENLFAKIDEVKQAIRALPPEI